MSAIEKDEPKPSWLPVIISCVALAGALFIVTYNHRHQQPGPVSLMSFGLEPLLEVSRPLNNITNPKFTVVEFMDYECPPCKASAKAIQDLESSEVQVRIAQFPLKMHLHAHALSIQSIDTKDSMFPTEHERLITLNPTKLDSTSERTTANPLAESKLSLSIVTGKRYGVSGTPTVFVFVTKTHALYKLASPADASSFIASQ